jgi:hypothetical protein
MLKDLEEIWTQNSMTGGTDRASTVRALVRGESAVAFETALQDASTAEDGQISPISVENVNQALSAVTETVFPHRALETQQPWMNKKMFKPVELTTRQMAASINCLNNALPFFPTATEASKFSEIELIGLLEWSLPATWRAKFDLDSYIPTLHSRAKLIEACEAIEQGKSPWRDHLGRRAASITDILKGQLQRTAQNLRNRKSSTVRVNTTAVNMGITLHTLQQTATQLKIRLKPRITPQGQTNKVFPTKISAKRSTCLPRHHPRRRFWRCMPLSSRESKPT